MKTKELSHAAQNLVIYVRNEREIYERYTLEAVAMVVKAKCTNDINGARLDDVTAWDNLSFWIGWQTVTKKAIQAAAKLVRKYDHITPTAADIEAATKVYAANIIDKAKYQIRRDKQEKLGRLKHELQNYIDNASFGLPETRRRNMILLHWDIRKFERELQNA